ncbi:MAG: helix-turn-helix transcriptional regulator [Oscillospiraceae bacterium]|nr:helix-turn-helix transcriptional regulator [Oscillospiraceae bacterium]MBQ7120151.1 helix-turn-helix transcriptional regulator [Oscillospiraceae bacterium]
MRDWLKKLREKNEFSQEDMAEKLGVVQGYYSMIENGERQKKLDLSIAIKLSEILGVSVEYIVEQEKRKEEAV